MHKSHRRLAQRTEYMAADNAYGIQSNGKEEKREYSTPVCIKKGTYFREFFPL